MIKAVGFDLDGTLFETHVNYDLLNNADREVLERHGVDFTEVFGTDPARKRPRYPIREWLERNGRTEEYPGIYREIDELCTFYETQYVDDARAFPGSLECLDVLKGKGLKVGILTRGARCYAETVVRDHGIYEKFDVLMGRDHSDYDNAKPSPRAMIEFSEELGVRPEEILYLGDNVTDYQSASGAGAVFVGVLSGATSRDLWAETDPSVRAVRYAGDVAGIIDEYLK